jgi:hypothetical protein
MPCRALCWAEDIANEVLDRTYDADVTAGRGRHAVHRQACERVRLQRFGYVISRVDVRERLPVGVPDDVAAGHLDSAPGCGEAAGSLRGRDGDVGYGRHRTGVLFLNPARGMATS